MHHEGHPAGHPVQLGGLRLGPLRPLERSGGLGARRRNRSGNGGKHLGPGKQEPAGKGQRRGGLEPDIAGQHQQEHRFAWSQAPRSKQGDEAHQIRTGEYADGLRQTSARPRAAVRGSEQQERHAVANPGQQVGGKRQPRASREEPRGAGAAKPASIRLSRSRSGCEASTRYSRKGIAAMTTAADRDRPGPDRSGTPPAPSAATAAAPLAMASA